MDRQELKRFKEDCAEQIDNCIIDESRLEFFPETKLSSVRYSKRKQVVRIKTYVRALVDCRDFLEKLKKDAAKKIAANIKAHYEFEATVSVRIIVHSDRLIPRLLRLLSLPRSSAK